MITNAEIEGFFFGVPEGTIPLERIEKAREKMYICHARGCKELQQEDYYLCDYHYGNTCGDHLIPIRECGCKL